MFALSVVRCVVFFSSPPGCVDHKTGFNNTNLQSVAFISAEDSELRWMRLGASGNGFLRAFGAEIRLFGEFPWNIHRVGS